MSRGVRRLAVSAGLVAVVASLAGAAAEPGPLDVELPGRLIDLAVLARPTGGDDVVLLVAPQIGETDPPEAAGSEASAAPPDGALLPPCPEDAPRPERAGPTRLYRLDPTRGGALTPLLDDLPSDATWIDPFDFDGRGDQDLLLAREGELVRLRVLRAPRLEVARGPTVAAEPGARWQRIAEVPAAWTTSLGSMRFWGPGAEGEPWRVWADVDLPIEARVRRSGIRLSSAAASWVGRRADGTFVFATAPESLAGRRLRTTRVDVHPSGSASVVDCWSGLPEAENVLERAFLMLDDEPVLLVTTKPAGKLSLFGEKRLRVFPLAADRSHLGRPPLVAVESRMNLWQNGHFFVRDVSADGRSDLVVAYWKGLKDARVALDVYLRREDGSFAASARTTAFDVDGGDREYLRFGDDVDGDGVPDLLLRAGDGLLLFRGNASDDGRRIVSEEPQRLLAGGASGEPASQVVAVGSDGVRTWREGAGSGLRERVVDLDGDGRPEVLEIDPGTATEPGRVRWRP